MRVNKEIGNDNTIVKLVKDGNATDRILIDLINEANEYGLDIIEINNTNNQPIVVMEELSKYLYNQKKKKKELDKKNRKNRSEIKDIILSRNIAEHDLITKCKKITEIINNGDRVRLIVKFRGRENSYKSDGNKIIENVKQKLNKDLKFSDITFDRNTISTTIVK